MFLSKCFEKIFRNSYTNIVDEPDDEWDTLYKFQITYITQNKISPKELTKKLNLPVSMCIYLHHINFYPSLNDNTNGLKLRTALKELRRSQKNGVIINWESIDNVSKDIAFDRFSTFFTREVKDTINKKHYCDSVDSVFYIGDRDVIQFCGNNVLNNCIQTKLINYFTIFCGNNELKNVKIEFHETNFL
jgi:hypothetical protein